MWPFILKGIGYMLHTFFNQQWPVHVKLQDILIDWQMAALDKDNRRDTVFDKVFKGALKEFHASLITYQSVSSQVTE